MMDTELNIGAWVVEPRRNLLRRGEEVRRVGHKVMAVLVCLARRGGRVVDKEELIAEVWDGAYTSDEALSTVVYELRKALDDDARDPRYIETIRKRGYRLMAPVRSPPLGPRTAIGAPTSPARRPTGRRAIAAVALAGAVLLSALAIRALRPGDPAGGRSPSAASGPLRSVAVLPMSSFNQECSQDFFAGGLTEMLTTELALLSTLEVAPSILVRSQGAPWSLERATEELAVDAVVEGSVLRAGDRLWISVQVVDTHSGRMLWGGAYERALGDALLVQKELAHEIALQVRALAAAGAPPTAPPTTGQSPAAPVGPR